MGENRGVTGSRRDHDPRGRREDRYYPPRPPADADGEHPGMANYPSDPDVGAGYRRPRRSPSMPSANRWLPPLDESHARERNSDPPPRSVGASAGQRVTVTRAAAQRSREMGSKMYGLVHRAATADGADKRSEEHTSELQSLRHLVCRLLLEKKKNDKNKTKSIRN